jgi:hypothetical protein
MIPSSVACTARRDGMGEKGMDTYGPGAQMAAAPAGQDTIAQQMGQPLDNRGQPEPPAESSGPNAGEIVGDILDPLGLHKLFE